jgi:hypothetical protein
MNGESATPTSTTGRSRPPDTNNGNVTGQLLSREAESIRRLWRME